MLVLQALRGLEEVTQGFRQMLGATQPPLLLGLTQVPAEFRPRQHQHLQAASAELLGWVMASVMTFATMKFVAGIGVIVDLCRLSSLEGRMRKSSGPTAITLLPQASGNRGMLDLTKVILRATGFR